MWFLNFRGPTLCRTRPPSVLSITEATCAPTGGGARVRSRRVQRQQAHSGASPQRRDTSRAAAWRNLGHRPLHFRTPLPQRKHRQHLRRSTTHRRNARLRAAMQDTVGYILHSALLVPYFSWQRSHAVHHSRTNHIDEGETHVPMKAANADGARLPALPLLLCHPCSAAAALPSLLCCFPSIPPGWSSRIRILPASPPGLLRGRHPARRRPASRPGPAPSPAPIGTARTLSAPWAALRLMGRASLNQPAQK